MNEHWESESNNVIGWAQEQRAMSEWLSKREYEGLGKTEELREKREEEWKLLTSEIEYCVIKLRAKILEHCWVIYNMKLRMKDDFWENQCPLWEYDCLVR